MELPTLKFSFDYGVCLWVKGGAVEPEDLPISDGLRRELEEANDEFPSYLDWSDPHYPPMWTLEQTHVFFDRMELVYKKLEEELRGKYTVINGLDGDRQMYCKPEYWVLEFRFDKGNTGIWYENCTMRYNELQVSDSLAKELRELCEKYNAKTDWTKEQETCFRRRAAFAGKKLQEELSGRYTVINCFEEYIEK